MKQLLATLALAAICTNAIAQYNSRVQLFTGNFKPQESYRVAADAKGSVINYIGASFEHRIYKNLGLKLQHMRWINTQNFGDSYSMYNMTSGFAPTGTVTGRSDYHALELAPTYTLRRGIHDVYIAAGPSITWGLTDMISKNNRDINNTWASIDMMQTTQTKAGIVAELGYDARILGPMSIGASAVYRHYEFFHTYAAQLNIGYNFNSINLHR